MRNKYFIMGICLVSNMSLLEASTHHSKCVYKERDSSINCRNEHWHHIPYYFFQNKSFHTLDLGVNNITSLISTMQFYEVTSRDRIEVLYLDNNQISKLPHNLFEALRNLHILDLSYNRLKHISRRFCRMTSLTDLNLDGNPIETISSSVFSCLANLQFLFLANSNLKSLPVNFVSGLNLVQLDLTGNTIENVDEIEFPSSVKLFPTSLQKYVPNS